MKCMFCNEEKECITLNKCKLFFYQTVNVCKKCREKYELDELLALKSSKKTTYKSKKPTLCPTCKINLVEIINNYEVGCVNCFTVFKKDIINILWKNLPNIGYTGENKKNKPEKQNKKVLKNKLEKLLEQALEMEDYEAALYFSKEIKKIGEI